MAEEPSIGGEFPGADIDAGVSVIVVDAGTGEGPRLHRHPYREVFVVVEGEATFTVGGHEEVRRAGEVAVAPAGVAHKFVNSGRGRLRQVDIHESPRYETEWLE
jgi:mannose-6-phosphate isomerase-like protein (cupin superfamily)